MKITNTQLKQIIKEELAAAEEVYSQAEEYALEGTAGSEELEEIYDLEELKAGLERAVRMRNAEVIMMIHKAISLLPKE